MKVARKRNCTRARRTTSLLNGTIDLTNDDWEITSFSSSSESSNCAGPSTSTSPVVVDLSSESDTLQSEAGISSSVNQSILNFPEALVIDDDDYLPPPPKMPVFDKPKQTPVCPVCFTDLAEASTVVTTKCGHMFCKSCVLDCIKVKPNCPICRKRISRNQLIVVFFNSS